MEFPMLTPRKNSNMYSTLVPNIIGPFHYISRFLISGVILCICSFNFFGWG